MAKAIGTLGNVDSWTVGGVTFVDLANITVLIGFSTGSTKGASLRKPNGTAGYAVAGTTLALRAYRTEIRNATATATQIFKIAYADNDAGQDANPPTLTNGVYYGDGTTSSNTSNLGNYVVLGNAIEGPLFFNVPTSKYTTVVQSFSGAGTINYTVIGYET